ncbi:MAG: LysR family transcriptional regulator, partial [Pseudomonas sp.]|nr:LysR family transcriptional regulator [Pseudomonas sp.]
MLSQLRDLDLQLLRLFVTVVECGGFSAAQGELGIGQSTISTQMAKLETRLGYRLCERGKAGFRLTPKGQQLLAATRKLFTALEMFKGEAQGMADKLLGELRIGLSEALDAQVRECVSEALGLFRQRNQAVQIELLSATPAELERRLLQGQLHLAIGYFSGQQNALDYQPLFSEEQRL